MTAVARRAGQARRLMREEGVAGVAARALTRLAERVAPPERRLGVFRGDVLAAAEVQASGRPVGVPLPSLPGERLTVAWVMTPPTGGSGGHTTLFRLVGALERAGHTCVVYLYDRWGGRLADHEAVVRAWWPWVQAEVRDAAGGIDDAHAVVATAWPTAYATLASPAKGARFYLVQDLEPWFYPAGAEALLAEATYRFGFHGITAGRWLAGTLTDRYGMAADHFDFGCDLGRYHLPPPPAASPAPAASSPAASPVPAASPPAASAAPGRTGVCFFARPITPRRAFDLGALALELFAARHPDVDIHLFGDAVGRLSFPATDHGVLTPDELNRLYQRCVAGLVLSATNVSLVPHEMLAAGCVPVVNDAPQNRVVLDNGHVVYAPATPHDLADALGRLVDRPAPEMAATAAAAGASVQGRSWDEAGAAVERTVRRVVEEAHRGA